jgi:signal transduction histidine kinase/DNA-binding response OmpR family regulator
MPRVLVVDDDPDIARALSGLLNLHGYEAPTAGSGERALELLAESPVDAVLLDVRLPGIDGFETCRRARKLCGPAVPILMLTAFGDAEAVRAGAEAGADDFLLKPPDMSLLILKVRALLRHKGLHDELEASRQDAQARARDLALLHEIGRDWSLIAEPEAFHRMVTERLAQLIGAPICVLGRYDSTTRTLSPALPAFGVPDENLRLLSYTLTPELGLSGFTAGRPYVSNHVQQDTRMRPLFGKHARLESLVLVPMLSEGVLLGLIAAANKAGGFSEADVQLMSLFAGPAGTWVRSRQLYDRQRRHALRLEKLAGLIGDMASARGRASLLTLTAARVCADLGCDRAAFHAVGAGDELTVEAQSGDLAAREDAELVRWAARGGAPLQTAQDAWSRLAVPVGPSGQPFGVLCASRRGDVAFAEEEVSVLAALAGQLAVGLERARNAAETEHLARQMATLYDVGLETSAQRDLQTLFRRAAEDAGRLIGADYTSVFRLDESAGVLRLFTAWAREPAVLGDPQPTFQLGEGVAGRVARDVVPVVVNDPDTAEGFVTRDAHVGRLLCLPLTYFDNELQRVAVFGVLNVTRRPGGAPFTHDDVEYLTRFASQLSIAAANSVAFGRERERSEQLALVNSLLREMAGSLLPERILQTAADRIREAFRYHAVLMGVPDADTGLLHIAAASAQDMPAEGWASQPKDVGLLGRALRERRTLHVPDVATEPEYVRRLLGTRSQLVVPVVAGDEAVAVLDVESDRPRAFGRNEVLTLETLADGIGILLRNAELYRALEQTNARLVDMDRSKGELVNLVAHDFRAPLTSILGFTELLETSLDDSIEVRGQHTRAIRESVLHMGLLVEKTLKTTRLENGQLPFDFALTDLAQVVREVVARMPAEHARRIALVLPEEPLPCWADRERLVELVENLASNAVKYSPATAPVEISIEREADAATLRVRDRGLGIAAQDVPRLFRPFSRLQRPGAPRVPGTGLGLYICERIVRAHGGRLGVESAPDEGATFWASLPLFGLAAQRRAPLVLVAASDPITRRLVGRAAASLGFVVHEVSDGVEALEAASRLLPRALVVDRVLPRLRADDLAERLQESEATAGLRLIVLAAREQLGENAFRFHGFVPKPLDHAALCVVLEDVLLGAPEGPAAATVAG